MEANNEVVATSVAATTESQTSIVASKEVVGSTGVVFASIGASKEVAATGGVADASSATHEDVFGA